MTPETTPDAKPDLVPQLAAELNLPARGVAAVVALLAEGNTVPFIARYRKERTGGLDEVQIRAIEDKRAYLTELEDRRAEFRQKLKSLRDRQRDLDRRMEDLSAQQDSLGEIQTDLGEQSEKIMDALVVDVREAVQDLVRNGKAIPSKY